jgi:hypothetical protein
LGELLKVLTKPANASGTLTRRFRGISRRQLVSGNAWERQGQITQTAVRPVILVGKWISMT